MSETDGVRTIYTPERLAEVSDLSISWTIDFLAMKISEAIADGGDADPGDVADFRALRAEAHDRLRAGSQCRELATNFPRVTQE